MTKILKSLLTLMAVFSICALFLSACTTEGSGVDSTSVKSVGAGAAAGAMIGGLSGTSIPVSAGIGAAVGGVVGYWLSCHQSVLEKLSAKGVSIMRFGDQIRITIPSQRLFVDYSVKISAEGQEILNQIAEILAPMNKVAITIAAYSPAVLQSDKDLFLTEKQAQAISNYFWDQHVDTRLIYAVGYGGGHPMQYDPNPAFNDLFGDRANYRVDITLKDYVTT
ncbi:MAG: OmpA family protein [Gammaproteobacteria bacterium]|nr:OmpA family protein [Gammaproteobacteria bacterium]MCD8542978.1 OmpA family protein [Gammaproteobacteria bacterium]